ncbi:SRPBCC family protein [Porifericola rhodea]|uniref:SRPBCC family protein n=1 Tax=Porifericola rhodea TaxID=930972 RepID=UPI00266663F1|nr:SRPBCC family protein [Porifericola rhodea]WKN33019.1 SRPBCC family protein [Porifericola rhodea]
MFLLKNTFLGIFLVAGLFLSVSYFLPASYHVERSIVIERPVSMVYPKVSNLHKWVDWNPWTESDSTVKTTIKGTGKEVGSVWSWNGKLVGIGSLTLQEVQPNKKISSKLAFEKPQMFESDDIWTFEEVPEGTKVTWINEGELSYPINRVFGLFLDGMLGPDYEKGLKNLKQISETY